MPAEIGEVVIGTPAYKAGVMVGDRVLAVDDEPVDNFSDLQRLVVKRPGEEIVLTVERGERTIRIPITPFEDTTSGEPGPSSTTNTDRPKAPCGRRCRSSIER